MSHHQTPEGEIFRQALGEGPEVAAVVVVGLRDEPEGPAVLISIGDVTVKTGNWSTLRRLVDGLEKAATYVWGPEEM